LGVHGVHREVVLLLDHLARGAEVAVCQKAATAIWLLPLLDGLAIVLLLILLILLLLLLLLIVELLLLVKLASGGLRGVQVVGFVKAVTRIRGEQFKLQVFGRHDPCTVNGTGTWLGTEGAVASTGTWLGTEGVVVTRGDRGHPVLHGG
jgi:hypothetical protein